MRLYDGATLIRVAHRWGVGWGSCSEEVDEYLATSCSSEKSLRVYQRKCENLCLCNRILLSQQVVQIQSDLIFSRLVAGTKFCCGSRQRFSQTFSRPHQAICRYDVSPQRVAESPDLHTRSDLSPRRTYCCNLSPSVSRLCPGEACPQVKFQV